MRFDLRTGPKGLIWECARIWDLRFEIRIQIRLFTRFEIWHWYLIWSLSITVTCSYTVFFEVHNTYCSWSLISLDSRWYYLQSRTEIDPRALWCNYMHDLLCRHGSVFIVVRLTAYVSACCIHSVPYCDLIWDCLSADDTLARHLIELLSSRSCAFTC